MPSVIFSARPVVATVIGDRKGLSNPMANASKAASQFKILYAEGDSDVLAPQATTLQKAGHQVETAEGRKAVEAAIRKGTFDVIVLGPTLSRNDRHHLPYMI